MAELRGDLETDAGPAVPLQPPGAVQHGDAARSGRLGLRPRPARVAAETVRQEMLTDDRFADVKTTVEAGNPEIQIVFDQERASQLNLVVRDIADRVVNSVRGEVATRYKLRDKQIDVLVRSVDSRAASIEEVRNLIVNPGAEFPVPLSAVADVKLAMGPAEVRRVEPGARGRRLRQPGARRPRLGRRPRSTASSQRVRAAGGHDRIPVGPERGNDATRSGRCSSCWCSRSSSSTWSWPRSSSR